MLVNLQFATPQPEASQNSICVGSPAKRLRDIGPPCWVIISHTVLFVGP